MSQNTCTKSRKVERVYPSRQKEGSKIAPDCCFHGNSMSSCLLLNHQSRQGPGLPSLSPSHPTGPDLALFIPKSHQMAGGWPGGLGGLAVPPACLALPRPVPVCISVEAEEGSPHHWEAGGPEGGRAQPGGCCG